MDRVEFEHVIRAAGAITGRDEIVVVGSQAILGSTPNAPAELTQSEELDLYVPGDESASDLIDGSIGERSPFHETFGYYAHGVGAETAILPRRWKERALKVRSERTGGVTAICPDATDLAISKLAAWREKDREFVHALVAHGIVAIAEIRSRLDELEPSMAHTLAVRLRSIDAHR